MPEPFIIPTNQWIANWIAKYRKCYSDMEYADAEREALIHLLDGMRRDVQALKNAQRHDE